MGIDHDKWPSARVANWAIWSMVGVACLGLCFLPSAIGRVGSDELRNRLAGIEAKLDVLLQIQTGQLKIEAVKKENHGD